MAFANKMTALINKIEQRLGTAPLTLPEHLSKDKWPEKVIVPMTIETFSRYLPNRIRYHIDATSPMKNGWYILDEDMFEGIEILGITNIDWNHLNGNQYDSRATNGIYDSYGGIGMGSGLSGVANTIFNTNVNSAYTTTLFPQFEYPNRFRLETVGGHPLVNGVNSYDVYVLIKHTPNLLSISPTQMETFEELAIADVAIFLYNELKYFDQVETVFANSNLRLDELAEKGNKREEVINTLKESYVSAANKNQPMLICV